MNTLTIFDSRELETQKLSSSSAAFIYLYDATNRMAGEVGSEDQLIEFSRVCKKHFKNLQKVKAKVIGPYLLARQIQQKLFEIEVQIEKAIYTKSYLIYYSPQTGVIKLSKTAIEKINVLVVDDSKTIRELLTRAISSHPEFCVVGQSENGQDLAEKIKTLDVHVLTLDMQMPVVNGVLALKQFFPKYPVPAIVVSAVSLEEGSLVMDAIDAGAFDYLQKPTHNNFEEFQTVLADKIKVAFLSKYKLSKIEHKNKININIDSPLIDTDKLVAVGSSTGGIEALREFLVRLPKNIPPIVIVQHIPAGFSKAFAERMDTLCPFLVKEGETGDEVVAGTVYIAAGGKQTAIKKEGSKYFLDVNDDGPVNRHKPSVDYTFFSLAKNCNKRIIAIMLTGMGSDGAKGMKQLKDNGALTIAESEESCVVYGMPQAAVNLGCVDHVLHIKDIASKTLQLLSTKTKFKKAL